MKHHPPPNHPPPFQGLGDATQLLITSLKAPKMDWNTGYNRDNDDESFLTGLSCLEPTLTQQQFKDDADINTIVERFGLTGKLPDNFTMPNYADISGLPASFTQAMQIITDTQAAFMQVPADIRARFANNPEAFMAFLHDDKNRDEALKMGLLQLPPEKTRDTLTPPQQADNKEPTK